MKQGRIQKSQTNAPSTEVKPAVEENIKPSFEF
ncbi:MAG: hypothetical protein ACI9LF_002175, partial [Flavobacteriales bacterium]